MRFMNCLQDSMIALVGRWFLLVAIIFFVLFCILWPYLLSFHFRLL